MKTKKPILRLAVLAALSFFTGNEVLAQQNVGAACGCPTTTGRTVMNIKAYAQSLGKWTDLPASAYGGEITGDITLTCDKMWVINEKIYVANNATLTIQPGTVIKGNTASSVAAATALIIERGGKINAAGTVDCPIIFTHLDDQLNGAYVLNQIGKWGGVLLCGKATNNLKLANNGPFIPGQSGKLAVADGLGVLEGFASSIPQDQFGANISGATGYVSATSPSSATYTFGINVVAAGTTSNIAHGAQNNSAIRVSSSSLAAYALVGTAITGNGIPANTTVTGVTSDVILLSNPLSQSITVGDTYTFTNSYPQSASTTGLFFQLSSAPSFAAGTGPVAQVAGSNPVVYANFAAPYNGTGNVLFDDNDNSGVMTYVSIRHSGANLLVGSEINGLTLASVGRGTKIEHIEIVSCADDNIEIFGGTVNLKWCTTLFGNDDMFDYDLGWSGKAQFLFGMKGPHQTGTGALSPDGDNGIEADSDDSQSGVFPRSHPIIYNATLIGNAKAAASSDNSAIAGINAKEFTEGEIYNSIIANFATGLNMQQVYGNTGRTNAKGGDVWHNWKSGATPTATTTGTGTSGSTQLTVGSATNIAAGAIVYGTGVPSWTTVSSISGTTVTLSANLTANAAGNYTFFSTNGSTSAITTNFPNGSESFKVKCNKFIANTNVLRFDSKNSAITGIAPAAADLTQFNSTDNNVTSATLDGFSGVFAMTQGTNTITTKNDVIPAVTASSGSSVTAALASGCPSAVNDGFFSIANYAGAFKPSDSNKDSWLSDWTYSQVKNMTSGLVACPTDLDKDGDTDVDDFGIFAPAFGTSCN